MRKLMMFIAVLVFATFASAASADGPTKYNFRGDTAEAYFSKTDGCIEKSTYVNVTDQVTWQSKGENVVSSIGFMQVSWYFVCSPWGSLGTVFESFALPAEAFVVSKNGQGATLKATVATASIGIVDIDLVWTSKKELVSGHNHSTVIYNGGATRVFYAGSFRGAEATGSIVGSEVLVDSTIKSHWGTIGRARSGTIQRD